MPPAARIMDATTHGMPLSPGPGSANVLIGFMPAWRATIDQHACPAVNVSGADGVGAVLLGSPTVFINNMMACRMGDIVMEKPGLALGPANPIILGCPTVMIGETAAPAAGAPGSMAGVTAPGSNSMMVMSQVIGGESGAAAQSLAGASQDGAATVPLAGSPGLAPAVGSSPDQTRSDRKVWVEIELLDDDGQPVPNEPYRIELPDGSATEGSTDDLGRARVDGIDPGNCNVTFPSLDQSSWKRK